MCSRFIKILACVSLMLISFSGFSQDAKVIEMINDGKYQESIDAILHEGEISKLDVQNLSSLAYCYVMLFDYPNAENVYQEITSRKKFDEETFMYLGEVQMKNEKYLNAKKSFQTYLETHPESLAAQVKIASCDSLKNWSNYTSEYSVSNHRQINTEFDEKSVCLMDGGIVFVSNVVSEDLRSNADLKKNEVRAYKYFDGNQASWFSELLENYTCEALDFSESRDLLAMTLREKTEYMYETNFSNAYICLATPNDINSLMKFEWEGMPENINLAHPAFANQGRRLYFVSDMDGGFGANDIWYSDFVDSKWQTPVNAGENINTAGNELFPVMVDDVLYFSTDGRAGYGNLDIFKAVDGSAPLNLRAPVNSGGNDYSFHKVDEYNGYFSSNRSNASQGMNDVFKWSLPLPPPPPPVDTTPEEPEIIVFNPDNFLLTPVFFTSEKDEVTEEYNDYLKQICDTLKQYSELKLKLTGHSDARGSKKFSSGLAMSRAENLAAKLMDMGVEKDRIEVVSAGISKDREAAGLTYHVQVGYSENAGSESWFEKKLKMPVFSFKVDENTAYCVGEFDTKAEAQQLKKEIESIFSGIVIASHKGERLPDLYYAPNRRVEIDFVK